MYTVEVSQLAKRFGNTQAVADVSFTVEPGEIFGMLGPNGAGKTTTIRMMLDIFKPDSGTVKIFGGNLDLTKKRRIGYLPEERGLYKDLKLEPTLIYLATLKGLDERTARDQLEEWLKRFDLYQHRNKKVQELSRGMGQKAQIIATLLHNPDLIVIDEPFAGLDPVNTRLVKQVLEEQRESGKSIIMSTHQMFQVESLCDRIVLIDAGKSVLYGPVDEIKRNFAGNAIKVSGQGDFSDLPGVVEARQQNGAWHMALEIGADPQSVLKALMTRDNVKIDRFELEQPSLDDIFINVVQNDSHKLEARHA
ncbi:MAG: ATP-binding cassette domain-containing protein [Anaerolineales bacterium]|nr:ATP-binding cassette domain-containing protein [Anaerolineales bacterium]